jgi:hypothetical protein
MAYRYYLFSGTPKSTMKVGFNSLQDGLDFIVNEKGRVIHFSYGLLKSFFTMSSTCLLKAVILQHYKLTYNSPFRSARKSGTFDYIVLK